MCAHERHADNVIVTIVGYSGLERALLRFQIHFSVLRPPWPFQFKCNDVYVLPFCHSQQNACLPEDTSINQTIQRHSCTAFICYGNRTTNTQDYRSRKPLSGFAVRLRHWPFSCLQMAPEEIILAKKKVKRDAN